MDIHEAIYTTRSMRRLKPDPIPLDVQARILDAAIRAPSEPDGRRFLLVDEPALKERIAPLYLEVWEENVDAAEVPPPGVGLNTVTARAAGVARSAVVIAASSSDGEM